MKITESIKSRWYRTYAHLPVDRLPDVEFGYWPQTIRRWLKEGLPAEYESEKNIMFSDKVDAFFGFDDRFADKHLILSNGAMNPKFERVILENCDDGSTIVRDEDGVTARRYLSDSDDSSIPHYLKFPVENPDDWAQLKEERYRKEDPVRKLTEEVIANAQKASAEGEKMMTMSFVGFYGILRNWMGFENLSFAFFDYPEMIHDMVNHWTEIHLQTIDALPPEVRVDYVFWWEDMASKNGPFVSSEMFREFLQPGYNRIMSAVKKRGCCFSHVDCDGNPHDLINNWMEEGVNIMFPLEVVAGVDPYAWRKEFGMKLGLKGGIAKAPLVEGGSAIDKELERIRPLMEQGGYIPHLDHLVPPDIPFKHYMQYIEKKRKLIGK